MREPIGGDVCLARGVEFAIYILVAIMRGVKGGRRFAGDEIVNIAVGVGATAPADKIGPKSPFTARSNDEYSVAWILMSNPASPAIDWITSAACKLSGYWVPSS